MKYWRKYALVYSFYVSSTKFGYMRKIKFGRFLSFGWSCFFHCKVLPILVLMGPRLFLSIFIFPLWIFFYAGFDWLKVSKIFFVIFFFFSILLFPPDLVIIIDSINTVTSIIVIIICTIIIFTIDIALVTILAFIFFCAISYF